MAGRNSRRRRDRTPAGDYFSQRGSFNLDRSDWVNMLSVRERRLVGLPAPPHTHRMMPEGCRSTAADWHAAQAAPVTGRN
jgi:hypothetical protein